jgi:uroporphyrinogen decarboxylase
MLALPPTSGIHSGFMNRREVVRRVLEHARPPYVPWSFGFTVEAGERLLGHYALADLQELKETLGDHLLRLGSEIGFFEPAGPDRVRDVFGVIWNRSIDKDIGNVEGSRLAAPSLRGYRFPDPLDPRFFADIPERIARFGDRFRVYEIGFSLWERAWTLRGLENMYADLVESPRFARELLGAIADWNLAQVRKALEFEIDGVLFGDDWGQQHGLQIGPRMWREFLRPPLEKMFAEVKRAGRFVLVHSCGDVQELFEELIGMGLDCFNPFQPEVMDVFALLERYRGRLSFFGGLSTQRTLPYGSPQEVRRETRRLLEAGAAGNYLFAPAHDVEGDVPLDNMLAFIETARDQLR